MRCLRVVFQHAATSDGSQAEGSKNVFATPFERQGSLIHLEPMHAVSGANSTEETTSQDGKSVVYCPVGTSKADSEKAGLLSSHTR